MKHSASLQIQRQFSCCNSGQIKLKKTVCGCAQVCIPFDRLLTPKRNFGFGFGISTELILEPLDAFSKHCAKLFVRAIVRNAHSNSVQAYQTIR